MVSSKGPVLTVVLTGFLVLAGTISIASTQNSAIHVATDLTLSDHAGRLGPRSDQDSMALAAASVANYTIKVGRAPTYMAYAPSSGQIYVSNSGSGTVSVVNSSSYLVAETISVGKQPQGLRFDPVNSELYVSHAGSTLISVIDTTNDSLLTSVRAKGTTCDCGSNLLVYDPANGDVYVLSATSKASFLSKIDHASNVVTSFRIGPQANNVVYDPATHDLVAVGASDGSVMIVNSTTNSVLTRKLPLTSGPFAETYDPANKRLYIVNTDVAQGPFPAIPDNVSILGPNNRIVATVTVGNSAGQAIVDPLNHDVYVLNSNLSFDVLTGSYSYQNSSISVIDPGNTVVATIPVGRGANSELFDPATGDIYVTSTVSNETFVINASTNELHGAPLPTRGNPLIVVLDPTTGGVVVVGDSQLYDSTSVARTLVTVISEKNRVVDTVEIGRGSPGQTVFDPSDGGTYVVNYDANSVSVID